MQNAKNEKLKFIILLVKKRKTLPVFHPDQVFLVPLLLPKKNHRYKSSLTLKISEEVPLYYQSTNHEPAHLWTFTSSISSFSFISFFPMLPHWTLEDKVKWVQRYFIDLNLFLNDIV